MLTLISLLLFGFPAQAAPPTAAVAAFLATPVAQRAAKLLETGLAVVTVESDSAIGTGVIFQIDGKPRVLTASHVLEGATSVKVKGAFSGLTAVGAKAALDLPADDLAVLSLDDGIVDPNTFAAIAKASLNVCTGASSCTTQPGATPGSETIVTASDGTPGFVRPQNRFVLAQKGADEYVSGRYPYLWMIGAYTRSGVSGGAYYRGGIFAGLVTKVSRGLQSLTIAIPSEGIAAALKAGAEGSAQWLPNNRLEVKDGSDVIVQAFREGGDVGNGGDDRRAPDGEPRAWHLLLTGCFYCMDDIHRLIENPFVGAGTQSPLLIGDKPVLAFSGHALQAATLARYRYLRSHGSQLGLVSPGGPELARLRAQRAAKPFNLRFFQIFNKEAGEVLENSRPMEGNFHDGVTVLLLDVFNSSGQDMISPYPEIDASKRDSWIDFSYPDEHLRFRVASDFSRVDIITAGTQGAVSLPAQPFSNPVKSLYGAGGGSRALFLYDESDLTALQSLIIETPAKVYQLNFCHPNVGCGI